MHLVKQRCFDLVVMDEAHALKDHDVVELAGVKMEFFVST